MGSSPTTGTKQESLELQWFEALFFYSSGFPGFSQAKIRSVMIDLFHTKMRKFHTNFHTPQEAAD